MTVLEAKLGEVQLLLDAEAKKTEELNEINSKLIGHGNAKQKVQHTVKVDCNPLASPPLPPLIPVLIKKPCRLLET